MYTYVINLIVIILVCYALVYYINLLVLSRNRLVIEKTNKVAEQLKKDYQFKVSYIERSLGIKPYEYQTISQLSEKLSEKYNTDIKHYLIYEYISNTKIHKDAYVEEYLPVDLMYDILSTISHKQELIFKFK